MTTARPSVNLGCHVRPSVGVQRVGVRRTGRRGHVSSRARCDLDNERAVGNASQHDRRPGHAVPGFPRLAGPHRALDRCCRWRSGASAVSNRCASSTSSKVPAGVTSVQSVPSVELQTRPAAAAAAGLRRVLVQRAHRDEAIGPARGPQGRSVCQARRRLPPWSMLRIVVEADVVGEALGWAVPESVAEAVASGSRTPSKGSG